MSIMYRGISGREGGLPYKSDWGDRQYLLGIKICALVPLLSLKVFKSKMTTPRCMLVPLGYQASDP